MSERLSEFAFRVAFVLSVAPMTLHDLFRSLAFEGVSPAERAQLLRRAVTDLAARNFVRWRYEPDYGNTTPIHPHDYGSQTLSEFWEKYLPDTTFAVDVPDKTHPTLFLYATDELGREIELDEYEHWRVTLGW